VRVVSELSSITLARGTAEEFLNLPMLRFDHRSLLGYRPGRKRLLDITLALSLSIATLPVYLLIAALLFLSGIRPVFRHEKRLQLRGETRAVPRFARPAAGEGGAAGALARSLFRVVPSLAGLPALHAVLAGRLSLVGPIPFGRETGRFADEWRRLLATLKPGVCDVSAVADHPWVPFRDPLGLNVYYVQNWSISLDLQIVLREWMRSFQDRDGREGKEQRLGP
jgi:lipopolysaccharide/colanic/teichoic acid biosynthesis glycosyltransferase